MKKRNNAFLIRLTDEELKALNLKVEKSGLSREAFARRCFENKRITEMPPVDYRQLIFEMRRVGQTLSRILRIANANNFFEAADLRECLERLRAVERKIHSSFFAPKQDDQ